MKKLFIIVLMLMGVSAFAQPRVNYTFTEDTAKAATEVYLTYPNGVNGNYVYGIQIKVKEKAGSPTAIVTPQASIITGHWFDLAPNDTLTAAGTPDSATVIISGTSTPALRYRWKVANGGTTTGDTTLVNGKILFKDP